MREFIITKDDADQRVDKFILKTMKTMPKSLMYKYIRNKKIKVNRKRCEISQRLQEGDTMQCYIAEEFFVQEHKENFKQVPDNFPIVYEDENLLIIDKPSGLLAHSDTADVQDNLADRVLHYLYNKGEFDPQLTQSFTPALCHRIDRNTQGIVMAAKNAMTLRFINEAIKTRQIEKQYLCIVEGHLEKKEDDLILYHQKQEGNHADIRRDYKEGYSEIRTRYRCLKEKEHYSLVEVDLLTGKSHQIRAVMAYLKHPLYGDVKYGARKNRRSDYQALCAYKLRFTLLDPPVEFEYLQSRYFTLDDVEICKQFDRL